MRAQRQGMTGFGRASGEADWGHWSVEARSVNGRGLDMRVNYPPGFEALDPSTKASAKGRFERGNVVVSVRIEVANGTESITVDRQALATCLAAWRAAAGSEAEPDGAVIAQLMNLRGVVVTSGGQGLRELAEDPGVMAVLSGGVQAALEALTRARIAEGRELVGLLTGLLDSMESRRLQGEAEAAGQASDVKARLLGRLAELGGVEGLDPGRLEAEAALLASRADVREELDRLRAHIAAGREMLAQPGSIGRKLDFLAQEMMREANTLCSKSVSLGLTEAGLALKSLIDQFKEQSANVE